MENNTLRSFEGFKYQLLIDVKDSQFLHKELRSLIRKTHKNINVSYNNNEFDILMFDQEYKLVRYDMVEQTYLYSKVPLKSVDVFVDILDEATEKSNRIGKSNSLTNKIIIPGSLTEIIWDKLNNMSGKFYDGLRVHIHEKYNPDEPRLAEIYNDKISMEYTVTGLYDAYLTSTEPITVTEFMDILNRFDVKQPQKRQILEIPRLAVDIIHKSLINSSTKQVPNLKVELEKPDEFGRFIIQIRTKTRKFKAVIDHAIEAAQIISEQPLSYEEFLNSINIENQLASGLLDGDIKYEIIIKANKNKNPFNPVDQNIIELLDSANQIFLTTNPDQELIALNLAMDDLKRVLERRILKRDYPDFFKTK